MKIFCYLEKFVNFGANSSVTDLSQYMTLEHATKVGFIINVEKSSLSPTTQPEFLGAKIEIPNLAARPADHRIGKTIYGSETEIARSIQSKNMAHVSAGLL